MQARQPAAVPLAVVAALAAVSLPAAASVHQMQIHQVLGRACGNSRQQAVQLRMRSSFQNQTQQARLRAFDAAGLNPVTLVDLGTAVTNHGAGVTVLAMTSQLATALGATPDFVMTAPIPPAYLRSGRVAFETDNGLQTYFAVAWGGAGYTGANLGTLDNDDDGDFNPAETSDLSTPASQGLVLDIAAATVHTTNAAAYGLTQGAASFTTNGGTVVTLPDCVFGDDFEIGDDDEWSATTPP